MFDLIIIGGGPAGLTAGSMLRRDFTNRSSKPSGFDSLPPRENSRFPDPFPAA